MLQCANKEKNYTTTSGFTTSMPSLMSAKDGIVSATPDLMRIDTYIFHHIHIIRLNTKNWFTQSFFDHLHVLPRLLIMHEVYRNTFPPESTRSP